MVRATSTYRTVCVCVCVCVHLHSVTQLCMILCDPMDCSVSGSCVHGILQARILEQVAISCSSGSSPPRDWTQVSCLSCLGRQILYCCTPWEASPKFWNLNPHPHGGGQWRSLSVQALPSITSLCLELFIYIYIFFFPFIFISWRLITLQYCSGFCHTLTRISHGFTCIPYPIPPPTSLSTQSLWVFPVYQAQALVSCIQPGLVICFTLDNSYTGSALLHAGFL